MMACPARQTDYRTKRDIIELLSLVRILLMKSLYMKNRLSFHGIYVWVKVFVLLLFMVGCGESVRFDGETMLRCILGKAFTGKMK